MHIMTNEDTVDERIRRFKASKSPWKTLGLTIADKLSVPQGTRTKNLGISYEQTRWRSTSHS